MPPIVLYCKSYSIDVRRVVRLAESIEKFNVDKLPFYISVPEIDIPIFRGYLKSFEVELISDEEIINSNKCIDKLKLSKLPGNISQQIVKSEFWRLDLCDSYLCLDSDCIFIRPFLRSEFITSTGTPYTVMDEGHELFEASLLQHGKKIVDDFQADAQRLKLLFNRQDRSYCFGPFPVIWHRAVWESLDKEFLQPQNMSLLDAIQRVPTESLWYGEALLRYQALPLMPCQPLFKVYHYAWQFDKDRNSRISLEKLAQIYGGVIYQSAWEREMDWPSEGGSWLSRSARRLRRVFGRI